MVEKFVDYFSSFRPLSSDEKDIIRTGTTVQHTKKGTVLLREGEIPNDNYFVIQGCIRQYYLIDGEEKTSHFFTEEDWILSFTGVESNGQSKYYLECLEDSYLVIINDNKGDEFLEKFPEFQQLSIKILEKEIVRQHDELAKYIEQTPEQRYITLQKNRPRLINRVPQYHISSYIGIKPESLSRIRKRILNNKTSN